MEKLVCKVISARHNTHSISDKKLAKVIHLAALVQNYASIWVGLAADVAAAIALKCLKSFFNLIDIDNDLFLNLNFKI